MAEQKQETPRPPDSANQPPRRVWVHPWMAQRQTPCNCGEDVEYVPESELARVREALRRLADGVDVFMDEATKGEHIKAQASFPIGESFVWALKNRVNEARAALTRDESEGQDDRQRSSIT